jgi:hypothetical protein
VLHQQHAECIAVTGAGAQQRGPFVYRPGENPSRSGELRFQTTPALQDRATHAAGQSGSQHSELGFTCAIPSVSLAASEDGGDSMHKLIRTIALFTAGFAGLCSLAPAAERSPSHPNILLIIGDYFGMDVTSDMYPGLIDGLVKQYGPSGLKHPDYQAI